MLYARIWRTNNFPSLCSECINCIGALWIFFVCVNTGLFLGVFLIWVLETNPVVPYWNSEICIPRKIFCSFFFRMQIRTSLNYWKRRADWCTAVALSTAILSAGGKERSAYSFKTESTNWGFFRFVSFFPSLGLLIFLTGLKVTGIKNIELGELQFWFTDQVN